MTYKVAERFKSVQGEGIYTGTPMAFIRFVGCSVGKKICQHCDTDFERVFPWDGGGEYTAKELVQWAGDYTHVCLTGGEPLDQDLSPLYEVFRNRVIHIETSGTVDWVPPPSTGPSLVRGTHIAVSPKPGFLPMMIARADEIKVIVPGLGGNPPDGTFWPTLEHALAWATAGKVVFLQPRNAKYDPDKRYVALCEELVRANPALRLSIQLHKFLRVR